MSEYVTYFAVFIMVLFGIAFFSALQGFKKLNDDDRSDSRRKPDKNI
jgi:hypothetical protein